MIEDDIVICDSYSTCNVAESFLMEADVIAADVETLPQDQLMNVNGYAGYIESTGETATFVFPFYKSKGLLNGPTQTAARALKISGRVNASGKRIVMHNGSYDSFWYMRYGIPVANYAFDTMVAWWALYPELQKSLAFVASILLDDYQYWKGDRKSDSWDTFLYYNGKDCKRTLQITDKLVDLLIDDPSAIRNYADAMRRNMTCFGMSNRGMLVDQEKLDGYSVDLHKAAEEKLEEIRYLIADPDFNPNSPPQKLRLFYTLLGAQKRNAKGRIVKRIQYASTGKVPLRVIRNEHPLFRIIADGVLGAIEPAKQISNVIGLEHYGSPPRFYTTYNGTGTTTSRLASATHILMVGGNAQNIRKTYRGFIRAESGNHVLLDIDYSAADDVNIAFESADPVKIELFRSGKDAHAYNASHLFPHWTYEAIVAGKKQGDPRVIDPITGIRQINKRVAHGANYLMAPMTLYMTVTREPLIAAAKELGFEDAGEWDEERLVRFCARLDMQYRSIYPRLVVPGKPNSWYDELARQVTQDGKYTTPFMYSQRFLGDPHDHATLRAIAATVGQAGTAGRINMAMDELDHGVIPRYFRDADNPAWDDSDICQISTGEFGLTSLRLQTHDSLTFNIDLDNDRWKEAVRRIFKAMQRPFYVRNSQTGKIEEVQIRIESEIGVNWGKGMVELQGNTVEAMELALREIAN